MAHEPIYPCLSVITSIGNAEEMTIALEDLGAVAIEERDESTIVKSKRGEMELVAGFSDSDARNQAAEFIREMDRGDLVIRTSDIAGDGWLDNWQKYFKPVVLRKIQIITPWMEPASDDHMTITIDPGQAFGTGGHTSTINVLKLIEKQALEEEGLPARVLDIGTGSGVLAIAAAKLGAVSVTAIDIDEESITATMANSKSNQVASAVETQLREPRDLDGKWPLVLANLELSIFNKCAKNIVECVDPLGTIYASGLLDEQVDEFLELFPSFRVLDQLNKEGWTGLALGRIS